MDNLAHIDKTAVKKDNHYMSEIIQAPAIYLVKIIGCLLLLNAAAITGFAEQPPEYEKFGTDRLTSKQLEKDTESAMKGDMKAAHRVGRHHCGLKNIQDGLRWLRISAALGSHEAQTDFFVISKVIDGDPLVHLEGKVWLKKACDAGYKHALFTRDANLEHGKRTDVEF
jgi:hypothetical protein